MKQYRMKIIMKHQQFKMANNENITKLVKKNVNPTKIIHFFVNNVTHGNEVLICFTGNNTLKDSDIFVDNVQQDLKCFQILQSILEIIILVYNLLVFFARKHINQ